jgi:site-specific recombinase XerD
VEKLFAAKPTSANELSMTSLRRRMTEDMQVRNFSPHTQNSYVQQVSLFARHFSKSPELLGPEEIRSYQVYLTNEKKLSPGSILIAVSALRFLYKVTLHRDWCFEDIIPAPKKPQTLPIVLSPEESPAVLKLRSEHQASHYPDDLLRCGTARFGGYPPESHRYR